MGCNYLSLPLIPASGTTLLNSKWPRVCRRQMPLPVHTMRRRDYPLSSDQGSAADVHPVAISVQLKWELPRPGTRGRCTTIDDVTIPPGLGRLTATFGWKYSVFFFITRSFSSTNTIIHINDIAIKRYSDLISSDNNNRQQVSDPVTAAFHPVAHVCTWPNDKSRENLCSPHCRAILSIIVNATLWNNICGNIWYRIWSTFQFLIFFLVEFIY